MVQPKPILGNYVMKEDVEITSLNATEFWLGNDEGHSFYLKWWGNGWVVTCAESYLCKVKNLKHHFKHKDDIVAFEQSHYGFAENWEHVFSTKEDAVEFYRTYNFPDHAVNEEFYNKVYDILVKFGGAPDDLYRKAFIFNFSKKEKFPDREWRFQGHLGFGGKYRNETNRVDCYQEDETPEIIEHIAKMNDALKALED